MQSRSDRANTGALQVGNLLIAETICVENKCLPVLFVQLIDHMNQLLAQQEITPSQCFGRYQRLRLATVFRGEDVGVCVDYKM